MILLSPTADRCDTAQGKDWCVENYLTSFSPEISQSFTCANHYIQNDSNHGKLVLYSYADDYERYLQERQILFHGVTDRSSRNHTSISFGNPIHDIGIQRYKSERSQ